MKKLFVTKEVKKAIRTAMNKTQRHSLDDGEIFTIRIKRLGRTLRRWGDDEDPTMINVATLKIRGRNLEILDTNLKERAWSWNPDKAFKEGVMALDYFVNGDRDEYAIYIGGTPGKGNR